MLFLRWCNIDTKIAEKYPVCWDGTWHMVTAWEGKGCQDLSLLKKGDEVHVIGRLRFRKYIDAAGIDRTQMDIVASNLERIS